MKYFFFSIVFLFMSQVSFAASANSNCVSSQVGKVEAHFTSGQVVDGALLCSSDNASAPELILTSSDACCFHRGADGTCYHENPACANCTCYHRTAGGNCVHCSCPQGCP